jgi:ribonuclease BN (tRNA processing enzyme)
MTKEHSLRAISPKFNQGRRGLLKSVAGLAGAGAALGFTAAMAQNGPGRSAGGERNPQGGVVTPTAVDLTGTHLLMLGTHGGPGVDLRRAMTSSVVLVDGTPYLVDCGYGTVRDLYACGLGYAKVDTVFFTHLHNDHTLDLPALLSLQWTSNKMHPTTVYGPYGTAAMVEGAKAFFAGDVGIRDVDEGRTIDPDKQFQGHDLAATSKPSQVFKNDKVRVSSIENAHFPERSRSKMPYRSLSYRFDTQERSIVFSGDTAFTKNLVELARGADIYVSEIMDQAIYNQMDKRAREEAAKGNPNNIWRHVAETHSTPTDVGRTAREAGVKTLVLNHLLPGTMVEGRLNFPVSTFIDGVRKEFSGEVIVADDLMVI